MTIPIDHGEVDRYDTLFAEYVLTHTETAMDALCRTISENGGWYAGAGERPTGATISGISKNRRIPIRDIRAEHQGVLVPIEGIIQRTTEIRPLLDTAAWECLRCHAIIKVPQEGSKTVEPIECEKDQGGCGRPCSTTSFKLIPSDSTWRDFQEVELHEQPEGLRGGERPQQLIIHLKSGLVSQLTPGSRCVVNGILRTKPRRGSNVFDIYLEAISVEPRESGYDDIEITPDDEDRIVTLSKDPLIFNRLSRSIAPAIYGMDREKDALLMQMAGGVAKTAPDGVTKIRGDIHILLVGDPGTAKSQLLRYVSELSPRGRYASGKSATSAGLTAAAVQSSPDSEFGRGRWVLEAGALVLSDDGLCCIDEIDKMSKEDRSSMHEAMEQQRISVAKAGITADLRCRCAILSAANPKEGRWDTSGMRTVADQINLPPTLISRFDVIFTVADQPDEKKDRELAGHIIGTHRAALGEKGRGIESVPDIPPDLLRKYIAYIRSNVTPRITNEAEHELSEFFLRIRGKYHETNTIPITPRQMEALIRLSESAAKIRLSERVEREDTEKAISVFEYYLGRVAQEGGVIDIDMIATGTSKTQKDVSYQILNILTEYPIDRVELLDRIEALGIDRYKGEIVLDKLVDSASVLEPRAGMYKRLM